MNEWVAQQAYEARRDELVHRLHLLACNSAGARVILASFDDERDRLRGVLADLVNARAQAIA